MDSLSSRIIQDPKTLFRILFSRNNSDPPMYILHWLSAIPTKTDEVLDFPSRCGPLGGLALFSSLWRIIDFWPWCLKTHVFWIHHLLNQFRAAPNIHLPGSSLSFPSAMSSAETPSLLSSAWLHPSSWTTGSPASPPPPPGSHSLPHDILLHLLFVLLIFTISHVSLCIS